MSSTPLLAGIQYKLVSSFFLTIGCNFDNASLSPEAFPFRNCFIPVIL